MAEQTVRYIRIDSPVEFRKATLESLKANIHSLQRVEKIKHLRQQKEVKMAELKELEKAINTLNNRLRSLLPKVKVSRHMPVAAPRARKGKKTTKKPVPTIPAQPSLDKLEGQLKKIEGKLGTLE